MEQETSKDEITNVSEQELDHVTGGGSTLEAFKNAARISPNARRTAIGLGVVTGIVGTGLALGLTH